MSNEPKYCIYRIINNINGKTYIGQHTYYGNNPILTRKNEKYTGSGKTLMEAYAKYGIDNFSYEIIKEGIEDKTEIDSLEKYYIQEERKNKGYKNVYNISDGGTGGVVWKGESPTCGKRMFNNGSIQLYADECPEGFKEGALTKISEEQRKSLSISHMGSNNPMYGKKWYHTLDGEERLLNIEEAQSDEKWIPGRIKGIKRNYVFTEEERRRRSERMKGHKVSDEVKRKISDTVRSTCNSEEWKKEHSLRTKEGMKKVESMSSVRDRYKEVKELGLLPLLGVYQDHWNNFRKYESIYGKVDINKLKKDSL
jgi:group I intron endonuclease